MVSAVDAAAAAFPIMEHFKYILKWIEQGNELDAALAQLPLLPAHGQSRFSLHPHSRLFPACVVVFKKIQGTLTLFPCVWNALIY